MSQPKLPQGMQKFQDEFKSKVRNAGTAKACIDCYICNKEISLTEMHVFIYEDKPVFTTKALCYECLNKEIIRKKVFGSAQPDPKFFN